MGKLTDKREGSVRKEATQQERGTFQCGRECGLLSSDLFSLFHFLYQWFWGVPTRGIIFLPDGYVWKKKKKILCLLFCSV